uniref:AMP-dependent synthetase/ligase domain-containing protein n=1 Tax=Triticum urartu TaxID=4572 RepID=A0A8R7VJR7_TRIUA
LPDHPALVDDATGIVVSYTSVIASARSLAGGLWSSLGLCLGDVALVIAPSAAEMAEIHFFRPKFKTQVVSPANPASTPKEYAHQVALFRPVVAFAAPEVAAKLPGHVRCVALRSDAYESLSSAGAKAAPPP